MAMTNKTQPYEKLVDYVKNHPQKGLTIPHADVEKILGVSRKKNVVVLTVSIEKLLLKLTVS